MKRLTHTLSFFVSLALLLAAAIPVGAETAEIAAFDDVAADAWYAPYVAYCAENGVMIGTGDRMFEPERSLTGAECVTLALRLYDLRRGGDGTLPQAPEDWGQIVYTTADGIETVRYEDEVQWLALTGRWLSWYPAIPLDTPEADAWGKGLEGTDATLSFGDGSWIGTARYLPLTQIADYYPYTSVEPDDAGSVLSYLYIEFKIGEQPPEELWWSMEGRCPGPSRWYRDAFWNVERLGLLEDINFGELTALKIGHSNNPAVDHLYDNACNRLPFAGAVAVAAGELDKINTVDAIPDMIREDGSPEWIPERYDPVYALYEAGVLTGVDEQMNFAPLKKLTRAEAAAIVVRVLNPDLRVRFSPEC